MEQFVLENTLGVCSENEDRLILKWLNLIRDDNVDHDPDTLDDVLNRSDSVLTKNVKNRLYGRDVFSGTVDAVTGEPCHGRRIYSLTQEVYEGPFQNGKRHGPGAVCTRLDGTSKFLGSYRDDYMHEGCLVTDKHTYNGFFHENHFHGKGVLIHVDGSIFEGTFAMGEYDHGTLTTENLSYVGSFASNKQDGPGKLTLRNGTVYEGDFKDDKRHGIGVETRNNGFVHHGNWESDLPHGHGTLKTDHVEVTGYWKVGQTSDGPGWTIKYPKLGVLYEGESKGGRPHGKGKLTITLGTTLFEYTGDFCHGLRHGYGTMISHAHVVYEGAWIGDEPVDRPEPAAKSQLQVGDGSTNFTHPEGKSGFESDPSGINEPCDSSKQTPLICHVGDSFCGQADADSNLHRFGLRIAKITGNLYSGEWHRSKMQGIGTVKFVHLGATYVGMLVDGKMEGKGCLKFPDGSEYKGMFRSGMMHGCGKLRDVVNSSVYSGEFFEGQKHGHGKEALPDGTLYEGEFAHNRREGQGKVYRRAQGQQKKTKVLIYEGEFKEGLRDGKGERFDCTFPCKGSFVGEFKEGRQEGHGVLTTEDGFSYEGEWNDWVPLDGDWVITEPGGVVYYGTAVCSPLAEGLPVPEGFGSQKYKNGEFYTGSWVNGKKHGTGMCVFETGEQWDGRWRNGIFVKFGRSSPYSNSI